MSSVSQIARRYAEALADSAGATGLTEVAAELGTFTTMVESNGELHAVFTSPLVQPEDKAAVLEAILERAKPSPIVANFLRVMQRNDRLQFLSAVNRAFGQEVDRRLGVVMAEVTTAAPLDDEERRALAGRLERMTGKRVKLTFSTDDDLIGGVVTRIGSRIYDGSVRAQLDSIRRQMAGRAGA